VTTYSPAHLAHPQDPRQSVCGIPAADVDRWETSDDPHDWHASACEDCVSGYEDAARPDDYTHDTGDPAIIDSLRAIVAAHQHAKLNGVLIDVWSAQVTILIWDRVKPHIQRRLLTLPPVALIQRCVAIYASITSGPARPDGDSQRPPN
jgi:hypothetical protein